MAESGVGRLHNPKNRVVYGNTQKIGAAGRDAAQRAGLNKNSFQQVSSRCRGVMISTLRCGRGDEHIDTVFDQLRTRQIAKEQPAVYAMRRRGVVLSGGAYTYRPLRICRRPLTPAPTRSPGMHSIDLESLFVARRSGCIDRERHKARAELPGGVRFPTSPQLTDCHLEGVVRIECPGKSG
jgi:hypothetical protein